jgi:CRP-like cAMP-binding protein
MADADALRRSKLLAALPQASLGEVAPRITVSTAMRDQVIHRQGEPMDSVLFPLDGLFSLVVTDPLGSFTSIATVGREGAMELAPTLGSVPVPTEVVCLIEGPIAEMATNDLRALLDTSPQFRSAIFRYMGARFVDCVETSACHRLHPLEARMARCLLTTRDRIERDEFLCTHEQLAGLLGASRPKVTGALKSLEAAGAIRHRRGAVRVLDASALEAMTCGCYRTIRDAFLAIEVPAD